MPTMPWKHDGWGRRRSGGRHDDHATVTGMAQATVGGALAYIVSSWRRTARTVVLIAAVGAPHASVITHWLRGVIR